MSTKKTENLLEQLDTLQQWSIEKRGFNIFATADGCNILVSYTTRYAVERLLGAVARNSTQCSANHCKYSLDRKNKLESSGESDSPTPKVSCQRSRKTRIGHRRNPRGIYHSSKTSPVASRK